MCPVSIRRQQTYMSKLMSSCPDCGSDSYSVKVDLCQSCGRGKPRYAPMLREDPFRKPVTPVTPAVTEGDVVTDGVTPHCPTCRCVKRTNAERQRAYRERKDEE